MVKNGFFVKLWNYLLLFTLGRGGRYGFVYTIVYFFVHLPLVYRTPRTNYGRDKSGRAIPTFLKSRGESRFAKKSGRPPWSRSRPDPTRFWSGFYPPRDISPIVGRNLKVSAHLTLVRGCQSLHRKAYAAKNVKKSSQPIWRCKAHFVIGYYFNMDEIVFPICCPINLTALQFPLIFFCKNSGTVSKRNKQCQLLLVS